MDRAVGPLVPAGVDPLAGHGHAVGDHHVGGREPELGPAPTVAVHHRSPGPGGAGPSSAAAPATSHCGQQARGCGWTTPPACGAVRLQGRGRPPRTRAAAPISVSSATLPGAAVTEVEVLPHHHQPGAQGPRRGPRARSPRPSRWPGPGRRGPPACGRCPPPPGARASGRDRSGAAGADSGRTTVAGWRSKVTTTLARPACGGLAPQLAQEVAVPEMDAVVGADGHRRAPWRARRSARGRRRPPRDEVTRAACAVPRCRRPARPRSPSSRRHPLPASTHDRHQSDRCRSPRRRPAAAPPSSSSAHGPSPLAPTDTRSRASPCETERAISASSSTWGRSRRACAGREHLRVGRAPSRVVGVVDAERADAGAPQVAEVGPATERVARGQRRGRGRRCPSSSPPRCGRPGLGRCRARHVEAVHRDRSGRALDLDPGPGQLVQSPPPTLRGRDHGRDLVDDAGRAMRPPCAPRPG